MSRYAKQVLQGEFGRTYMAMKTRRGYRDKEKETKVKICSYVIFVSERPKRDER